MSLPNKEPPRYTLLMELTGWTLDRTADIPKSARFTFGQRVDNLTLDALQFAVRALRSPRSRGAATESRDAEAAVTTGWREPSMA